MQSMYRINQRQFQCPIELSIHTISGKWKMTIICRLLEGKKRYGEIKKEIRGIQHKVLAEQLRELEEAGILLRREYPSIPPKVEYELTDLGKGLKPLMDILEQWGRQFEVGTEQKYLQ